MGWGRKGYNGIWQQRRGDATLKGRPMPTLCLPMPTLKAAQGNSLACLSSPAKMAPADRKPERAGKNGGSSAAEHLKIPSPVDWPPNKPVQPNDELETCWRETSELDWIGCDGIGCYGIGSDGIGSAQFISYWMSPGRV